MSRSFTLRTLALTATAICAVAVADDVFLGTPGTVNLDAYPDGSFIYLGLNELAEAVPGVIATNTNAKEFDMIFTFSDSIVTLNAATFTGATFGPYLLANETSTVNYNGGENPILEMTTFDDAVINVTGGTIAAVGTGGGELGSGGSATVSGGTIMQAIACQRGHINVTGGSYATPTYGAPFSFISLVEAGVSFSGTGLVATYVGDGTAYGFPGNMWQLSGTLADGHSVNGLQMVDVGIFDQTVIVNYTGVAIAGGDQPPVASAGADFSVNEGAVDPVGLDGSASSDPNGDAMTFSWTQLAGTTVVLTGADSATPSFVAPTSVGGDETLVFELTVTANGQSSADTVSVTVLNVDQPPVADAGTDFSVDEGMLVNLDGTWSVDPDGDTLTYSWAQVAGPSVGLSNSHSATPSFTSPSVAYGGETLSFELTVTANGQSATDTVSVSVVNVNHVPVANAGADQSVAEGSPVTLHGEGSFDSDNDLVFYTWVQVGGTPTVLLSDADSANPTFAAPFVGSGGAALVFELHVTDGFPADEPAPGYGFSNAVDTVTINVTNVNHVPTANAGPDQVVNECKIGTLNGTASSDPDSDVLTYSWVQTSGPSVTLTGANTVKPTFVAPSVNSCSNVTLKFRLTVNDGFGGSGTDEVVIQVRNVGQPPDVSHARPSECELWPPNHQLECIEIEGVSSQGGDCQITITNITQCEPTNGLGDGDTAIDGFIKPHGKALIRSERAGNGNGRVYKIYFKATNASGTSTGMVKVCVPKSRHGNASDGNQCHDSTH